MELYEEVDRRRAERYARRMECIEREARLERILAPVKLVAQVVTLGALMYLYLFFGCLWVSM